MHTFDPAYTVAELHNVLAQLPRDAQFSIDMDVVYCTGLVVTYIEAENKVLFTAV